MHFNNLGRWIARLIAFFLIWCTSAITHATPVVSTSYTVSLFASGIGAADGMAIDPISGDLYVSDYDGNRVIKFAAGSNAFSTFATGIPFVTDVISIDGRVFATSGSTGNLYEIETGGSTSIFATGLTNPTAITSIGSSLYVANSGAGTISEIDLAGNVSTYVSGYSAGNGPFGITSDAAGNLYFSEHISGDIFRVNTNSSIDLLGSLPSSLGAGQMVAGANDDLFIADSTIGSVYRLDSSGNLTIFASGFEGKSSPPFIGPTGLVFDTEGNLLVGDGDNIWQITTVPLPASAWLFVSAITGLAALKRRLS